MRSQGGKGQHTFFPGAIGRLRCAASCRPFGPMSVGSFVVNRPNRQPPCQRSVPAVRRDAFGGRSRCRLGDKVTNYGEVVFLSNFHPRREAGEYAIPDYRSSPFLKCLENCRSRFASEPFQPRLPVRSDTIPSSYKLDAPASGSLTTGYTGSRCVLVVWPMAANLTPSSYKLDAPASGSLTTEYTGSRCLLVVWPMAANLTPSSLPRKGLHGYNP